MNTKQNRHSISITGATFKRMQELLATLNVAASRYVEILVHDDPQREVGAAEPRHRPGIGVPSAKEKRGGVSISDRTYRMLRDELWPMDMTVCGYIEGLILHDLDARARSRAPTPEPRSAPDGSGIYTL